MTACCIILISIIILRSGCRLSSWLTCCVTMRRGMVLAADTPAALKRTLIALSGMGVIEFADVCRGFRRSAARSMRCALCPIGLPPRGYGRYVSVGGWLDGSYARALAMPAWMYTGWMARRERLHCARATMSCVRCTGSYRLTGWHLRGMSGPVRAERGGSRWSARDAGPGAGCAAHIPRAETGGAGPADPTCCRCCRCTRSN